MRVSSDAFLFFVLFGLMAFYPLPARAGESNAFISHYPDSSEIDRARLTGVIIGGSAIGLGALGGLYFAWYANHPQSSFHFHDDLRDWLQMDKGGHLTSSYYIGMLGYEALRWAGVDKKQATWLGGSMGSVYLAAIEIFDGFSAGWGASMSDFAANTLGSAMFISQQLAWDEQRILLKYSYHPTEFAAYRPELLGSNHFERMIKDYNGMTFWLSVNPNSFGFEQFPVWLNIALGYSGTGMTGGSENITGYHNGRYVPGFDRKRQFFFSFDIDLSRIETRSSTMNLILKSLGFIKIPFPAIEFDGNKNFRLHALYF